MLIVFEVARFRGELLRVQLLVYEVEYILLHMSVIEAVSERAHEDVIETKGKVPCFNPCIYSSEERLAFLEDDLESVWVSL